MNVFFIPSWYPSATDPLPGIFFREQAMALVRHFEDVNVGISTWGQNDERFLLWTGEPFKSLKKLLLKSTPKQHENILIPDRLIEYYSPAFTWSSKFLNGNMDKIINANINNFHAFQDSFGKADIIHAHVGYPAGHIANQISQKTGIPFVITEQMSPFPHKYFIDKKQRLLPELQKAYQATSLNIAISNALVSDMKKHQIPNLKVIPNLVDEEHYGPTSISKKDKTFTFFTLGRMVPQKGIDVLLKAFSNLEENAFLRIGGDGPFLNKYKKLASELKIDYKIIWLGELDKTRALEEYHHCDAFVLPSRHESMGVVFAEAMACGKPVIATICGGPEEFIDDSNGYLVDVEDDKALSQAMKKMIVNYDQFNSKEIRSKFELRFSSGVVTRQIREVYKNVIGHSNR